jgi:hypothetical protein
MERFGFRNFGVLSFLQQIDTRRFLVPLLRPHAAYLGSRGVFVEHLANTDADDRRLLAVFNAADEELPPSLLEALCILDDLADEAGHDLILAELERDDIPLRAVLGDDLSHGEFAIAVFVRRPQLVREAHRQIALATLRSYHEFPAVRDAPIALAAATAKLPALEKLLGSWFESKNRTPACRIGLTGQNEDLWFEIVHGRPYRMIGTINAELEHDRVGYRPQQHDSVVFRRRGCVLEVNADTAGERDLYRQAFGMAFFENENHFLSRDVYSLESLRRPGAKLTMVSGVEAARLTQLRAHVDDDQGSVHTWKNEDLLAAGGPLQSDGLARGKIMSASFLLTFATGGPPRPLEIRLPNVALYDRARDAGVTEDFLRANEFVIGRP